MNEKFRAWVKPVYENDELIYGNYWIDNIISINFSQVTNLMLGIIPVGISYYEPTLGFPVGHIAHLKMEEIELVPSTTLYDINGDNRELYAGYRMEYNYSVAETRKGIIEWAVTGQWIIRAENGGLINLYEALNHFHAKYIGNKFEEGEHV
jgi:hypothetical protein